MELDLDSLLATAAPSDDDDDDDDDDDSSAFPHRRTVDEILNDDSDSTSSDDEPFNPPVPKQELQPPAKDLDRSVIEISSSETLEEDHTGPSSLWRPPRQLASAASLSSLATRGNSTVSRPLPHLFGSVRPSPKPGAALAAAVAASRSVPTPHAAAIKSRRSAGNLEKDVPAMESTAEVVAVEESVGFEGSGSFEVARPSGEEDESVESSHFSSSVEGIGQSSEDTSGGGDDVLETLAPEDESTATKEIEATDEHPDTIEDMADLNSPPSTPVIGNVEESSTFSSSETILSSPPPLAPPPSSEIENGQQLDVEESSNFQEIERDVIDRSTSHDGEASVLGEETNLRSDTVELPDEKLGQLGSSKKASRKAEKKLRASMKPLEWAEELEKRQASSGLHWEEGAAAQPMRLEGIRRGPPAVGYLQIDPDNVITRAISSQAFQRDHGSPQVLAAHLSFIAVGTTKGIVLVMPSKYSPHSTDSMDSKMLLLGSQGEKSLSPVTSMCFNQQGDMLLVGYGDGHLTLWDMQKATAAKVITGEHTAPVVHLSFLGQDAQVTRQFKAVTGDSKGLVLLHTFSVVPLLYRFSIKTQCLLDGKKTGTVLSVSPLLMDDTHLGGLTSIQGNSTISPGSLGSMVGGVVGGVVGGEAGWKLFNEGTLSVDEGVVVFVTHQNALVVRLSPSLEVYKNLSKPDGVREGSIPYTAWKCSLCLRGSSKEHASANTSESTSWLVIAWDRKILVFKLVKSELKTHREWSIDSVAIGVAWLDDQMLVILTLRGQLCLFSRDGTELHRSSFLLDGSGGDDIIAYHTNFSNSFGNPEKAYHNSVAVRGATIYVLGPMHLIASRLLPWKERIQVLQRAGDWMGALDMSMRLYDGQAHGVVDLPRTVDAIREAIMPYLLELLVSYVDEVFSYISVAFCNQIEKNSEADDQNARSNSVHVEMEEQFARVGGVAVEFCLHIKRIDILFDDIFSKFVAVKHGGTFLEILEPYILKDMLGCLPPEIMQALVEHYSSKGWLQRVEQCVLHMDISSLDFNQVVRLCRENGLYGALIYLFNQGLDDYKTPLEELLVVVQNLQKTDAAAIGYRMLVYLKYCFVGLSFPPGHGNISISRLPSLREELLQFLLQDSSASNSQVIKSFMSSCGACPNLCYLLWLDTEATMEVLRCAFSDDALTKTDDFSQNVIDPSTEDKCETSYENPDKQKMVQNTVNSLISVFDIESDVIRTFEIDNGGSLEIWPSKKGIGHAIEFIAFFVACKQAIVPAKVLKHILEYLTSTDSSPTCLNQKIEARQKEKQVISLLKVVPERDWNTSYVLDVCVGAHYYQACGLIYTIRGQYIAALESYLKDLDEPAHAFAFIHRMLSHLKEAEYLSFRLAVISRLPELVRLSREGTFFLVVDCLSEESQQILSELQSDPQGLFLFLKTTIDIHLQGTLIFSALERCRSSNVPFGGKNKNGCTDLEVYLERLSIFPKLLLRNPIHVTDEIAELYLELLCRYERGSVLKFLETFENYRLEHSLRLCQDYGITDAAAFLLERAGDVGGAFILTMTGITEKFDILATAVQNIVSEVTRSMVDAEQLNGISKMNEFTAVHDVLYASIGLCQRNTQRLDPEESESLWFRLLDTFCEPLRKLYYGKEIYERTDHGATSSQTFKVRGQGGLVNDASILRRVFSQFIGEIVEAMAGYIPLPAIMAKLLNDNGTQEFGDFKFTVLGMLGTYGFERRILDTAKSLIEDDTFYTMSLLKKGASHAYAPQSFVCSVCGCMLTKESSASGILVFNCGHATHLHCESQENEPTERGGSMGCIVCMPKRKTGRPRGKSILVDNGLIKNSSSRVPKQGANNIHHLHEAEQMERPYALQQMSRFEILSNLQKAQGSLQIDSLPQLRLAPPAIYHEKVQKGTGVLLGERNLTSVGSEKQSKSTQQLETKSKGLSKRFTLRSSIFGSERSHIQLRSSRP